jgi:hypothetical protein
LGPAITTACGVVLSATDEEYREGIAIAPENECTSGGFKKLFWSDDSNLDHHSLRVGSIPCGPLF